MSASRTRFATKMSCDVLVECDSRKARFYLPLLPDPLFPAGIKWWPEVGLGTRLTTIQIGSVLCALDVQGFHNFSMGQVEYHFLNQ